MVEDRAQIQTVRQERTGQDQEFRLIDDSRKLLADMSGEIDKVGTGERVWLRAMYVQAGFAMSALEPHLIAAAQRGADVRIIADPISFYLTEGMPSYLRNVPILGREDLGKKYQDTLDLHRRLGKHATIILSKPQSLRRQVFPFTGADHIKGVVVGNAAYFGDKNFEDGGFMDMHGFMVKVQNPEIVERLAEEIIDIEPRTEDSFHKFSDGTYLIRDAGIKGQSAIYRKAVNLVAHQKRGGFIGAGFQFLPEGDILQELNKALQRGVGVQIVTSRLGVFRPSPPLYAIERINANRMKRKGNQLKVAFSPEGVHAKYVIIQDPNNPNADRVLFGSHNFSQWGVNAGTAEMAILSSDPELIAQVRDFHDRLFRASLTHKPMQYSG